MRSLKSQVMYIFAVLLIPILLFFLIYSIYTMTAIKTSMKESAQNTLYLYRQELDNDLKNIESNLSDLVANNEDYKQLHRPLSHVDAHLASYAVLDHYKNLMNTFPILGAMYVNSGENALNRGVFKDGYSYEMKQAMEALTKELTESDASERQAGWYVRQVNDCYFLCRILGIQNTLCIAMVDLRMIVKPQDEVGGGQGRILLASAEGMPYGDQDFIEENGITLPSEEQKIYMTGKGPRYFVVSKGLSEAKGVNMTYLAPFSGFFVEMNGMQIGLALLALTVIFLIPACYYYLKRNFFYPLANLTDTINQIRGGNLDVQMDTSYRNREFYQVSVTFNDMMKQIGELKIAAYEAELGLQQTRLQYLQLQLRPHFFLNCLKNLFGLAQEREYQKIQNMILELSDYLRHTFRDGTTFVTMEEERRHVEHYIALQQMSSLRKIQLAMVVKPELASALLPPLSIQTFVENSVKYADTGTEPLKIQVKVIFLEDGDRNYLNLSIKDNGQGYPETFLQRVKEGDVKEAEGTQHVGIYNICRRIALIYNGEGSVSFYNQMGACTEIFLPERVKEKEKRAMQDELPAQ